MPAHDTELVPTAYLGCGGSKPGVVRWSPGSDPVAAVSLKPGWSVYRLAVSPEGHRVAIGTRNRAAGDAYAPVVVYSIDEKGLLIPEPVGFWYQPSFVTGLDMIKNGRTVSCGWDGQLHIWREGEEEAEGSASLGDLPLLALRCLSADLVAVTGADGILRFVDIPSLSLKRQLQLPNQQGAGSPALLALEVASELGLLVVQSPGGQALLYDLSEGVSLEGALGHAVTGLALCGGSLAVADSATSELQLYSLPGTELRATADLDVPVHTLASLDADRCLAVHRDGSVSVWRVGNELRIEERLTVGDVRCAHGPPRAAQLELARRRQSEDRSRELESARNLLRSGDWQELDRKLEELTRTGLGLEALRLLAESYRARERTLWELRTRMAIAAEVERSPENAEHYYRLGEILLEVDEPARARRAFQDAADCDADYRNVRSLLERLPKEVEACEPGTVRDDLAGDTNRVCEEIEKMAVLGEVWAWPVAVERRRLERSFASEHFDLDALAQRLGGGEWSVRDTTVRSTGGTRMTKWAWGDEEAAGPRTLAVEALEESGEVHLVIRSLVLPPDPEGTPLVIGATMVERVRREQRDTAGAGFEELCERVRRSADAAVSTSLEDLF